MALDQSDMPSTACSVVISTFDLELVKKPGPLRDSLLDR